MADNVAITAGSGTTIAADDIGGVLYQRVKPVHGADGTATDTSAAAPLPVSDATAITELQSLVTALETARLAVNLVVGEAGAAGGAGATGTDTLRIVTAEDDALVDAIKTAVEAIQAVAESTTPTSIATRSEGAVVSLTTPTGALADGDVMAATQEIASFFTENGGRGVLQSVVAIDTDDQGVAFDLVFFNANTSLGAEDSAPDIDDTEVLTVLGVVSIGVTDEASPNHSPWVDLGANRVATRTGVALHMEAGAATTSVWVAAITRGTPTYASGVVTVKLGFLQD